MNVTLKTARKEDLEEIWEMQVEAFSSLLEKYQDFETSPAAEDLEKINDRMDIVFYEKN